MTDKTILTIGGSDSTGESGIQADIKTIAALGGRALTAVTCITLQREGRIAEITNLPAELVMNQVEAIISDAHPKAIKIGLVCDADVVRQIRNEVIACRNLVVAPGIYSSDGSQMADELTVAAIRKYLIPEARLLMLRCRDAEKMLGMSIATDDDMKLAASRLHDMGAEWVLLRGGQHTNGRLTALLCGNGTQQFFTSYNTEGWQRHGVAGALSAAITTRLAMGDDVPTAIRNAHDYMHSQVVYAKVDDDRARRPVDIYNAFVSLVAEHYTRAHDVSFYADRLCITSRYLSQTTDKVVGKSPKLIIADYITSEAKTYLRTTRHDIKEIANCLGFASVSAFSKFFRKNEGQSPGEYRDALSFSEQ